MNTRTEHDSLGTVEVPADKYWAAQTQRSVQNFPIGRGHEQMPEEIIRSFGILKSACAKANNRLRPQKMTEEKVALIVSAADEIAAGQLYEHFPLVVWQTGSGTQTNMNCNEVIANRGNEIAGEKLLHPNDDVNMSQSSNDTFPSAMNIAAVLSIKELLLPAVDSMINSLKELESKNEGIMKCGRTHLQDAVPVSFSQELSGWRNNIEIDRAHIENALEPLCSLAIGGTAVGTGLNSPDGFGDLVAEEISKSTGIKFVSAANKFHALSSRNEFVYAHGALKALAADIMKMANDIRWLASGPRCGLGEIKIPANEPGSSIMPGKVNPTQCEQATMVAVQVMGNDAAIGVAASQGNFELNVFLPVIAYNFLQSVRLLSESIESLRKRCVEGITANESSMAAHLERSLMLVTALSPVIGYEKAAEIAQIADRNNMSLKEAALSTGYISEEEYDICVDPKKMV